MENIITEQNEMIVGIFQVSNSILASVCGLSIHCYILYKILRGYSSLTHYQNLIVVQSAVGAALVVVQLIANERETLSGKQVMSFSFLPYGPVTEKIVLFLAGLFYSFEQFLIMIFSVHRVLVLLREDWIKKFYIVIAPFVLAYAFGLGFARSSSRKQMETLMRLMFVPSILVISTACYILIHRHFRSNSGYSKKVKQMQTRFSTSVFLEGVIHGVLVLAVLLLIPLNLLFASLTNEDWTKATPFSLIYSVIVLILFRWYSVVVGALTLWSIYGFFKNKDKPRSSTVVSSRRSHTHGNTAL